MSSSRQPGYQQYDLGDNGPRNVAGFQAIGHVLDIKER
jgi:hypothetical protein